MALISVKCTKTETEYIYAKGENGKSILSGNNPPDANFGNNGDFFIDLSSFNLYGPKNNGNWGQPIANLKGVDGKDGITPKINIKDGYWTINGERTNQKAILDAPTISISEDGFWVINNEKTNKKAIGENGVTPKIEIKDGFWHINGQKTNQKAQGDNGKTPKIEIKDGFWYINGEKTNQKAQGEKGNNGKDGVTPTISISEDGFWVINNEKTNKKAIGENGVTPKIEIKDGFWYINDVKTNQKAQGEKGNDGKDGKTPTISISEDGFWVINNEKTNQKAQGDSGKTPKIEIKDGFWYINDVKTNQKAQGDSGKTPKIEIKDGFWYINDVKKINGKVFNIKAIGNDGQKGKDGTKITISADGYWEFDGVKSEHKAIAESGTKIYSGTTNPENNLGKEGDFYLQTETKTIYGPKTNSGWGEGITLTNNPIFKEGIDYNLSNDKTMLLKWLNHNTKHINMNTDPKLRKVRKIEKLAFSDDKNPLQLTSIVISKNVKEIGEYTFRNCTKLKSIELPDGLTKISDGIFMNCIRLESIDIPDSVTNIGRATFENCFFISSIIISKNVKEIGINAFSNCHQLTSVYLEPLTPPTLKRSPFDTNSIKIYVKGNEVKQIYEKAPIWKNFTIKDLNF